MIQYQVNFNRANQHLLQVRLIIEQPLTKGQEFWLPDWLPGSYMIRDFSKNIQWIKASSDGKSVQLLKQSKSTWYLAQAVDCLELDYQVYAWDLSVRTAHFDQEHCFFNGSSLFIAVKGLESQRHTLQIARDAICEHKKWRVATSMRPEKADKQGFGRYYSDNYAELIDHPFEIANFIEAEFKIKGISHKMIFTEAPDDIDLHRITTDVQKICQQTSQMFDDDLPFEHYYFFTLVLKKGFGGLEHRASTALHCSRSDLPLLGEGINSGDPSESVQYNVAKSDGYKTFLALCSHEYFHAWNVKRIKPAVFKDYELQQPVYTPLLWFFEGITSYYDELMLLRAGVIRQSDYLEMIAKNISRYRRGSGRQLQSISESSFDAWTRFYQQDENAPNAIVSYYVKGGLLAMLLDDELRKGSDNRNSLDDLMRLLWQRHGKPQIGVQDTSIQNLAAELTDESLDDFFASVLDSTEELPLENFFEFCGINFQLLPQKKMLETGGYTKKPIKRRPVASLSISHKPNPLGAEVVSVFDQGCATKFGLSNKDVIIAINDFRVDCSDLDKQIATYPIGHKIKLSLFRRDKLHHFELILAASNNNSCYLSFNDQPVSENFNLWVADSKARLKVK